MADKKMYKVGITVKEPWSADISYEVLDITLYAVENGGDGCSYIAIRANQGVTPGTDDTVWVKATQRGQSIYDLAVKYGDFEGTEAEFEAEYEAAVHAAQSAAQSASDIEARVETNEAARVTAERARSDAETARSSAETARINAENARNDAESLRDTAESDRVRAEAGRVTAEASRVEAETFRQGAEQSRRQQFEGLKTDMETAIDNVDAKSAEIAEDIEGYEANEAARVSAEQSRVSAESSRVSAESARATAETARQTAEGNRATAETERASAEVARTTAEQGRVSAEQGRVSAESGRVSAESERVAAETARESASATAVQNAETATAAANTATEHAEEAAATIDEKIAGKADKSEVSQLRSEVDGNSVLRQDSFIGGWSITQSAYYKDTNSARVGINEFALQVGDTIELSDYSKSRMYIGWQDSSRVHGAQGWLSAKFIAPVDGTYVITIEGIPAARVTDTAELTQYLVVNRAESEIVRLSEQIKTSEERIGIAEKKIAPIYPKSYLFTPSGASGNKTVATGLYFQEGHKYRLDVVYESNAATIYFNDAGGNKILQITGGISQSDYYFIAGPNYQNITLGGYFAPAAIGKNFEYIFTDITAQELRDASALNQDVALITYHSRPNLDVSGMKFTIYESTLIRIGRTFVNIPNDIILQIPTATTVNILAYDYTNSTFRIIAYTTALGATEIFVAAFRIEAGTLFDIVSPFVITVDGEPYPKILAKTYRTIPTINIVNHRGYNSIAPENTMPAFVLSKRKGYGVVETDVRFTSDGVPVCLHDATIDRTSNGTGKIASMTYAQALTYDFGSWFSAEYAGTKILAFSDFMVYCKKSGLVPYVELKDLDSAKAQTIYNIVKNCGMLDKTVFISAVPSFLPLISALIPSARLGLVSSSASQTTVNDCVGLKNGQNEVFVDLVHTAVTQEFVDMCIAADIPLEIWTVQNAALLDSYPYISGITTNSFRYWAIV